MPAAMAEWTVMVFLNAKNNLEQFSFINFDQMSRVPDSDHVNVLVEFGRPQNHYVHYYGGWSETLRFRVTEGMEPTKANALESLGQVNMGDGAALADFINWARREYPAKHEMLVLWDHGQGWRLRSAETMQVTVQEQETLSGARRSAREAGGVRGGSVLPDDMRLHGSFRYVSHDEDTGDKLYNREIQDTLEALDGKPIDVIGFDACLMAMIETAYALRRVGTVMVASEELEPGDGWDYERWLKPLVAAPADYDAAGVGRLVVDAYRDHYGDNDDTTLSAVDLTRVPAAASAVSSFSDAAIAGLDAQLDALKAARDACLVYAPTHGLSSIDLVRFLEQVGAQQGVDGALASAASDAAKLVRATVDDNYASASRQGNFGSNGVGAYFPASKLLFEQDADRGGYELENKLYPVEFVTAEAWAKLLHAYFAKVPS